MKIIKSALLTGVGVTTLSLGTAGVASAHSATNVQQQPQQSLAAKIAEKFNINQTDVQNIINQYHSEHKANWTAKQTSKLQQAVTDGKLTQDQANHIIDTWKDIGTLAAQAKSSDRNANSEVWKQIKQKVDDLKAWAKDQGIDAKYISFGARGHHHDWNRHTNHSKSH